MTLNQNCKVAIMSVHMTNKTKGSSNNLPCYPPDSHQSQDAVY